MLHASRKAFLSDLLQLRTDSGLTLEQVQAKTKIPIITLKEFEKNGLFDNPKFNTVYLKALASTYGECIGIDLDCMRMSLSEAIVGTYQGRLLDKSIPPLEQKVDTSENPVEMVSQPLIPNEPSPQETSTIRTSVDKNRPSLLTWRQFVILGGGILAVLAIVFLPWPESDIKAPVETSQSTNTEESTVTSEPEVEQSTIIPEPELESEPAESELPPSNLVLGDPFYVILVANKKIEGIRIQIDNDVVRPYWLEAGSMMAIETSQRFEIRNPPDSMQLLVHDYEIPATLSAGDVPWVITRENLQELIPTLSSPVEETLPSYPNEIRIAWSGGQVRYLPASEITGG